MRYVFGFFYGADGCQEWRPIVPTQRARAEFFNVMADDGWGVAKHDDAARCSVLYRNGVLCVAIGVMV